MNQQKIRAEINGDASCCGECLLFRVRFHKCVNEAERPSTGPKWPFAMTVGSVMDWATSKISIDVISRNFPIAVRVELGRDSFNRCLLVYKRRVELQDDIFAIGRARK